MTAHTVRMQPGPASPPVGDEACKLSPRLPELPTLVRAGPPHRARAPGRAAPTSPPPLLFPCLQKGHLSRGKTSQELVPLKKYLHGKKRKPPKKGLDLSDLMSFGQRRIHFKRSDKAKEGTEAGLGGTSAGAGGGALGDVGKFRLQPVIPLHNRGCAAGQTTCPLTRGPARWEPGPGRDPWVLARSQSHHAPIPQTGLRFGQQEPEKLCPARLRVPAGMCRVH